MNVKQFVLATLLAAAMLTVAFIPMSSQQDVREYDPWFDMNDDGKIDIRDLAAMAKRFGALGTPINKTQLLLELKARTDALNASVIELQSRKGVVAGQISGLPDLTLDQPMPYLSGATGANTIVVASGVGNLSGHTNPTPLAIQGQVTSPNTIRFAVYDVYGNEYDPNDAAWNSIEINYIVIDR